MAAARKSFTEKVKETLNTYITFKSIKVNRKSTFTKFFTPNPKKGIHRAELYLALLNEPNQSSLKELLVIYSLVNSSGPTLKSWLVQNHGSSLEIADLQKAIYSKISKKVAKFYPNKEKECNHDKLSKDIKTYVLEPLENYVNQNKPPKDKNLMPIDKVFNHYLTSIGAEKFRPEEEARRSSISKI